MEVPEYPQYINLELTARCNKSCSFCPTQQYLLYKKMGHSGHIDIELVKKVSDEIPKGTNVSFHKDGEVLLYPKLEEALDIMHQHFTHFCTNGVLLDKMASKLIGKVDLITYSVWDDETTSNVFETGEKSVIKFLEKLNNADTNTGTKKTKVNIKTFDKKLFEKWSAIHNDVFHREVDNWAGQYDNGKQYNYENPFCESIYDQLSINFDGSVSSCCLDYKHLSLIGDVFDDSVYDIWHGEKMATLRHLIDTNQLKKTAICDGCSDLCEKNN